IQRVSIERVLPHTLRIRVCEREPIAQISVLRSRSGGGTEPLVFNIDVEAALIPPLDPQWRNPAVAQPTETLPLITGAKVLDVRPGQCVHLPQVTAALDLVLAFERSTMATLLDIKKIDAASPGVLTATTSEGSEVTFGISDFEQQLRRWYAVQQSGQKYGKAISTLDLAITNHIPAKWLEASLVPPTAPKAPRTPRIRKKQHV